MSQALRFPYSAALLFKQYSSTLLNHFVWSQPGASLQALRSESSPPTPPL